MITKEDLLYKSFPVLDDGDVMLMDVMGDDQAIVDAARISFGKGTKRASEDRDLIRYLMRNHHGTPFEMAELKFRVRVPMDTWRQWIRHRTANVNEYSTRYSEAIDSKQKTGAGEWRLQATDNKQGSSGFLRSWPEDREPLNKEAPGEMLSRQEAVFHQLSDALYKQRLDCGVAREQARKDLPLSTYTEAYWKCDLRNLLHFLALRMDSHAQQEIRAYANVIGSAIVAPLFPITWEAFQDYTLGSVSLSRLDLQMSRRLSNWNPSADAASFDSEAKEIWGDLKKCRERDECRAKMVRLGFKVDE